MGPGWRLFKTSLGHFAALLSPKGLVAISLPRDDPNEALSRLVDSLPRGMALTEGKPLASLGQRLGTEMRAYSRGEPTRFSLPIDWRGISAFDRLVLRAVLRIPHGCVASYGDVAATIGKPTAARAVGQAVGRNRWPIVVPCHRVVASGGRPGGFGGGLEMKFRLLRLEGITGLKSPKSLRSLKSLRGSGC